MKTSTLLLVLVYLGFFSPNESISQNYQCLYSNDTNYYQNSTGYILATRTDSITMVGSDSLFHSFKTLRNPLNQNFRLFLEKNWYGTDVLIKENGENIFKNLDDEEIIIKTNAVLNDTFLLYKKDLDSINGWISKHDTMTIFGVLDSVKYISIFGNKLLEIDFDHFILSKHFGLVNLFPFYSFPSEYYSAFGFERAWPVFGDGSVVLIGSENLKKGVRLSTKKEMNDFHEGDILHASYDGHRGSWGESMYEWRLYNRKVLNIDELVGDSIKVTFDVSEKIAHLFSDCEPFDYSKERIVDFSEERIFNNLPEEFSRDLNGDVSNNSFWYSMRTNECGLLEYRSFGEFLDVVSEDEIYLDGGIGAGSSWTDSVYIEGAGLLGVFSSIYDGFSITRCEIEMKYIEMADRTSCGEKSFVGLQEKFEDKNKIIIYPNPATNQFQIKGEVVVDNLTIFDLSGRVVLTKVNPSRDVNVEELLPGNYVIAIQTEDSSHKLKFVKI